MSMKPSFHLSIGVGSMEDSVTFFVDVLRAEVQHRDPSGYVNIDWFGSQITLKPHAGIVPDLPDFHFGINLELTEFERLASHVLANGRQFIAAEPEVWDEGTPMERKKMYLRCPTGYLVELKGYR